MGNICRSPSAQGVFEHLIKQKGLAEKFTIDSAGTHRYHVGSPPDERSILFAHKRGIDLSKQRARNISAQDFTYFDLIVAMDDENYRNLLTICGKNQQEKLLKMKQFLPQSQYTEIPDPYYGGQQGFDLVLDLLEDACLGLLDFVLQQQISKKLM